VNRFLNKGPRWEIGKIPSYWIDKILLREPEYDDGHYVEVSWLLDTFIDGLRSPKVDLIQREISPCMLTDSRIWNFIVVQTFLNGCFLCAARLL
jgi:hypothetical protein